MNAVQVTPETLTSIRIDPIRRRAVVGADAPVAAVRAAAARAGLSYPFRPPTPEATVTEQLRSGLVARAWLRQRAQLRQVALVGLIGSTGRPFVLRRDERLATVHRELTAALREGATVIYAVLDLAEPEPLHLSMAVTFDDRVAAARAAQDVLAMGRVSSIDVADEAALSVVAGYAGLELYPAGAMVFVELTGSDEAVMQRDVRLVEDACFLHGATSIREKQQDAEVSEAVERIVTSSGPVLASLGFACLHDAVLGMSELAHVVTELSRLERDEALRMVVVVDGSCGRVSCWLAPEPDDSAGRGEDDERAR